MGLYERLVGTEEPKLPVHTFMAALGEVERGKITAGQAASAFGLSPGEQTEATSLVGRIVTPTESLPMGGRFLLTNVGTSYVPIALALVECAGITGFDLAVACNRNGSAGTVSWQLFDETNGQEITRIDDTTGAGDKIITTTVSFGSPLAKGVRRILVRVKSTTAADDPIHAGTGVLIRRVERLSPQELHEVLLLGEAGHYTVAQVKTRLGV